MKFCRLAIVLVLFSFAVRAVAESHINPGVGIQLHLLQGPVQTAGSDRNPITATFKLKMVVAAAAVNGLFNEE